MIKLKIQDENWKVFLLDEDEFERDHPGLAACTLPSLRHMVFNKEELTEQTVRHEIFHLAVAQTGTGGAGLNGDQTEEVCAEVFGVRGEALCKQSRSLYRRLKKLLEND